MAEDAAGFTHRGITIMTRLIILASIVSLAIVKSGLAHAQAAISEPGAYAFYHPNGDVLRAGPQYYGGFGAANAMTSAPVAPRAVRGHRHGRTQ